MFSVLAIVGCASWLGGTPSAARAAQALAADQSETTFVTTQMGVPVNGRFQDF